jgi:hypothetical protein
MFHGLEASRSRLWPCFALGLLSTFVVARAEAPRPVALHLVDDRGKPVEGPVEACFNVELRSDCQPVAAGAAAYAPPSFHGLRIEGEDHGPVTLRREQMRALPDGSFRVALARKAMLGVETKLRQKPLTVSLYLPQDATFREPFFRATLAPGQAQMRIPAGELIASLMVAGDAPDLQRLAAHPGQRLRLTYRQRQGWSVLMRCVAAASGRPVKGAVVRVADDPGFGRPQRPLAEALSDAHGLALISGLTASTASVALRHPNFLSTDRYGLTAGPGTFAFREEALGVGGQLRAHVSVHGRPVPAATCLLVTPAPGSANRRHPERQIWEGGVDASGVCVSARLPAGSYRLRVKVPQGDAQIGRWVEVHEAQDSDEDVALTPTHISGIVRRAGKPAATYRVRATLADLAHPEGSRADASSEATSDEEGKFELTLWAPGMYTFRLRSPAGAPVGGHREITTEGDDEQKVDFDLAATSVAGTVVDEQGRPLAEANVGLIGWEGGIVTDTDAHGRFAFEVQGPGSGTLHAHKIGFRTAEEAVTLAEGAPASSVILVLERTSVARGTLLSAAGAPVPGAWVASTESGPEQGPHLFLASRSQDDGTFEVEVPPGPQRLFASGPGCPLAWYDLPPPATPDPTGGEADASALPPASLTCPPQPAALELTLVDAKAMPIAHAALILRRGATVVPREVLADHLALLGLSAETDAAGHLVLAGLSPGEYELFLASSAYEDSIAAGLRWGFLTSVALPALETTEIQVTVPR